MIALDEIDRRLLRLLQTNGRLTNAELSDRVGLSSSACHRRVQRMESEGVIAGYVAVLDAKASGRTATVFVEIGLSGQSDDVLDAFERGVAQIPDVLECHLMAGSADYLLKVAARDAEDFARIHRQKLSRLPGVARMQSSFSLKTVRASTALPL